MNDRSHLRASARWLWTPLAVVGGFGRGFAPSGGGGGASPKRADDFPRFFETSSDPMLVLDAGHTILAANPAAARFLAVPHDRLANASVLEVDLLARLLTAG